MASGEDEFEYFLDNGSILRVPRRRRLGEEDGVGPMMAWYRIWELFMAAAAIAAVILLGLILHCCRHRDDKVKGSGPLPLNESLSVVLSPDQPPIPVNGTVNALITDPIPIAEILDPVEVFGTVNTTLPLGECLANESLCVSLAQDSGPIEVSVVNANFTVNATIDPMIQAEIIGPFGGECDANSSLCVSLAPLEDPLPVNGTVLAALDSPYGQCDVDDGLCVTVSGPLDVNATIVGPLGPQCAANESLCVSLPPETAVVVSNETLDVSINQTVDVVVTNPVILANDSLAVTLDGIDVGTCSSNSSLCVSVVQDAPLQVEVTNQQPIVVDNLTLDVGPVAIANETLAVALDGVGVGGTCDGNSSLCVSVANENPLQVEVINQQPIVVDNLTLDIGAVAITNETLSVALDGVDVGTCTGNSSLCVSITQDAVLETFVVNPVGIDVQSTTGPLPVALVNATISVDPITLANDTLSVELDGVGVGGVCDANSSLCVSLAQDSPVEVEVINSITINDTTPISVVFGGGPIAVDPVVVANDTLSVQLDGVGVGGTCDANSSLCVSLAQDAPLQVVNAPGDVLAVSLGNASFDVTIPAEVNATITGPVGPETPQEQAVAVTLTNDAVLVTQQSDNTTDLFGRTRVSNARGIFDFKSLDPVNEVLSFDNAQVSGTGTAVSFSENLAAIVLAVSPTTAGSRVRQTLRRFNYQPGNTQVVYMTVNPEETPAGITKRWGYFDEGNGLFFETRDDNSLFAVLRTNTTGIPVDTSVNVTDVLPADFSFLDLRLWVIEFAWMGATNVRFGYYRGNTLIVLFQTTVPQPLVWTSTPNHPLRLEISNDGSGPGNAFYSSAMSVRSEGASQPFAQSFSVDRLGDPLSITTDGLLHPLIGVRLRNPTYEGASALLGGLAQVSLDGNIIYRWALLYRADITGVAPVWTFRPESPLESAAPSAAAQCNNGQQFASGYVVGTSQTSGGLFDVPPQVYLGSLIDGTPLELWLCVERYDNGGGSDDVVGGITMLVSF